MSNPTKSTILRNFCSDISLFKAVFIPKQPRKSHVTTPLRCCFRTSSKTAANGKVLEQKLFRMVDLVGFDTGMKLLHPFRNFAENRTSKLNRPHCRAKIQRMTNRIKTRIYELTIDGCANIFVIIDNALSL